MYLFHTVHCYPWGLLTVKHQINSSCPNVLRPKSPATLYNLLHVYLSYVKILFNEFVVLTSEWQHTLRLIIQITH